MQDCRKPDVALFGASLIGWYLLGTSPLGSYLKFETARALQAKWEAWLQSKAEQRLQDRCASNNDVKTASAIAVLPAKPPQNGGPKLAKVGPS